MRPLKLTAADLAYAYELHQEYGFSYESIAAELKVSRARLNMNILRCEREGLSWLTAKTRKKRK